MASNGAKYIDSLIVKLGLESGSKIKKTLIELTKMTKNKENVHYFCVKGGLKHLFVLIKRPNITIADMALSTLANCAREAESRREIRRLDGIASLAFVLKTVNQTSLLNRASRALANLAEDELSVLVMDELGIIPELVKLLQRTSDSDCQQSVLRALRMVCSTPKRKQAVFDFDAIKTIIDLLKNEKPALVNCCVRTVAELTKGCNREIAQQVQDSGGVKYIVELTNSGIVQVRHAALVSLSNLAYHAQVRVCIGSEGGVQALTQQLKREEPGQVTVRAIEGLCFCCREAINRTRVCESGALELLLKILSSGICLSLEKKIVTAFTCFYYSEAALDILLSGNLVPTLIAHLNKILSHLPSRSEGDDHEDDFSDQLSFTSDFSSDSSRSTIVKDSLDTSGETVMDERLLEKLEETAREVSVSDSKASGRLSNFKRRMKLKPSPIPTTPPPGVCTLGSGQSVFSFASRHTDTTSLVSMCTLSRTISSVASSCDSKKLLITAASSYIPGMQSSFQACTPSKTAFSTDEQSRHFPEDLEREYTERNQEIFNAKYSMTSSTSVPVSDQTPITTVSSETKLSGGLGSPLSPQSQTSLHHHRSPGHSSLVLLSRISHMTDPSSLLVNKPCIQVLLDYLCLVENPSPKCARILNCLALNLLCFKALVISGAVVAIHHQLCCMNTEWEETVSSVNQCITDLRDSTHQAQCQSFVIDCNETRPQVSVLEHDRKASSSTDDGVFHCMSSGSQSYCQETGKHLLEVFSKQAQTPFAKGILENLLLKGQKEEQDECLLVLPLLCRTKKLKKQLLLERNGLRKFCNLFSSAAPASKTFTTVVESLVVLANDLQVKLPGDVAIKEEKASSKSLSETALCSLNPNPQVLQTNDNSVEVHRDKRQKLNSKDTRVHKCTAVTQDCISCPYNQNPLGPYDVKFQVDTGTVISAHKQILKGSSDVFSAMLSDCYLESTQSVINIPEVSADVFEFAVHHIYGCTSLFSQETLSVALGCCEVLGSVPRSGNEVQFFLQLLVFSDRFMLDELRVVSEQSLITLIDTNTIVQICDYGLRLNSPLLCTHCLSYLLKVDISELPTHLHLFKELFLCTERKDVIEQLYQFLLSHVKQHVSV